MKATREKEENRQVFLRIELDKAEVDKALEQAYRRLVKKAEIPGFRQGKAPRAVLERYVGKDGLLEDALNNLLPEVYEQVLKDENIEPIANPQIEVVQSEPVVFTAVVPLKPTVELGDYKSIRLKPEKAEVTKEEVDTVIEQIRRQHGNWEPVERPVAFEDLVVMDVEARAEDKPFINQPGAQYQVMPNQSLPAPEFADRLIGMKVGEEKEFKLKLPDDYSQPELAGKVASFRVKVNEVKQQQLPKLDKEFAQTVSPDLKTVAALRQRVTSNLSLQVEQRAKEAFEEKVLDAVVESSKMEFPPVLAEPRSRGQPVLWRPRHEQGARGADPRSAQDVAGDGLSRARHRGSALHEERHAVLRHQEPAAAQGLQGGLRAPSTAELRGVARGGARDVSLR